MTQAFSKTELAQGHALFCNPALHTTNWRRKYPQFPAAVACRARSAWMHTSHKHTHSHLRVFNRCFYQGSAFCCIIMWRSAGEVCSVWVFMTEKEKNRQTALDGIQTEILDKILGHFIIRHKLLYTVFLSSKLVALHSGIVFFPDDTWNAKKYSPSGHPWL